jgi:hypothetical protein
MKYLFGTHIHGETGKIYPTIKFFEPFEQLGVISFIDDVDEFEYLVEWIEELNERNISDYSENGFIIHQPFLFGSKKSKIAKIENNKFIGLQEFYTIDFLNVCYAWRDFLKSNISIT